MKPTRSRKACVAPVGDGGLDEGLVGVGRRGLVLRAAHDDAGIGLLHHVQQHVGVLVLRALGAVALRIGVGGDVERIRAQHPLHVPADVRRRSAGSTSFSTSWPSNSDHISPTVSSPTRVTTPPMSSSTAFDRIALGVPVFLA